MIEVQDLIVSRAQLGSPIRRGGDPQKVIDSLQKRYAPTEIVDEVIALWNDAYQTRYKASQFGAKINAVQKEIGQLKKAKQDADHLLQEKANLEKEKKKIEEEATEKERLRDRKCKLIGNYVHDSVPVNDNEDFNEVVTKWAPEGFTEEKRDCLSHHEVMTRAEVYDGERGVKLVGHRGYFLRKWGVLLNQALINYGLHFLVSKGYDPLQPPYFMKAEYMAKTAQLEQFDEELYKVIEDKDAEDKFLIATSEQPISAMFADEWLTEKDLPKKFAGYSSCFRKEAGAHGRDAWGEIRSSVLIGAVQIEQFLFVKPEESWQALEDMKSIAEEFYQSLKLPYRVVAIVSGALNNAAAKKYDLEAWFPYQNEYKELVSCSNCTDYQTRELEIRYGQKKGAIDARKTYVHALNGTLCATERTLCCLVENYQREDGIEVPEVLRRYMPPGTPDIIPYTKDLPKDTVSTKGKQPTKPKTGGGAPEGGPKRDMPAVENVADKMKDMKV
ncbi:serine-tRNA ligase [Cladophialophora bantiana CBS 173.52]|uniref:serine--tRNA ligase n=1 Tax=Cladophialophora bantiana (strain ATCC 10958 / CBS 173.52 / CDC B-1940 / NIH 8579) TaxID=1442370 RepID=A0A0D2GJD1_CLAB1|nr:serine-tRNA ligase [Cladophialophora bantiana CBS 173.52]KIW98482.1 serine-tRNA ligase [Cladophialophora bantiana CBS 173.52]